MIETIGAYGANGSNINLNSGTVALTGNKSTGYYLDAGTGSTIASGAKINVTGEEANGVYANSGSTLTYSGDHNSRWRCCLWIDCRWRL